MKVLVLGDTHIGPSRPKRRLPDAVYSLLADVDAVLHTGDVTDRSLLDELAGFAPVHAVLGNNDAFPLPERLEVELAGARVGMVHDSGPKQGRGARLRSWFPACDVVCFGHSHLPWLVHHERQLHLNPGSPTERRLAPTKTVAVLTIADGQAKAALVDV